jgi:outer membrane protein TolC
MKRLNLYLIGVGAFLWYTGMSVPAQVVGLTLEQFRELVLLQNLEIEASRLGYESAQHLFRAERGALFEPVLGMGVEREHNQRENTSEQFVSQGVEDFEERNRSYDLTVEQPLPTGGRLSLAYNLSDLQNNLLEQRNIEGLEREYNAFMGLTFVQPLLRNGGWSTAFAAMRMAKAESEVSFQAWRRQLMQTLASAEAAYWDLYTAQERVSLRKDSVRVAEQVVEDNQARVDTGRMSEIEVRRAQAGLALRQAQLSEAEQALIEASARLKSFFAELVDANGLLVQALDAPVLEQLTMDQRLAHDMALALHPEYLTRVHQVEQDNIRVQYARNQRWPQVDFVASYGYNGLGDSAGNSWDRLNDRDFKAWNMGVQLRLPLGGDVRSRNELAAARRRAEQGLKGLEAASIELGNQLVTSWRRVENQFEQSGHYENVKQMNEALLELELTRLDLGQSDSRQVLEVEEELTQSRESYMTSITRYMVALIELELANGAFLMNRSADPMASATYRESIPEERRLPEISPELDPFRPVPRGSPVVSPAPASVASPPPPAVPSDLYQPIPRSTPTPRQDASAASDEETDRPQPVPIEEAVPVPTRALDPTQPVPRRAAPVVEPEPIEVPAPARTLDPTQPVPRRAAPVVEPEPIEVPAPTRTLDPTQPVPRRAAPVVEPEPIEVPAPARTLDPSQPVPRR